MTFWIVTRIDSGETRVVETYNNVWAAEACGWKLRDCIVRPAPAAQGALS